MERLLARTKPLTIFLFTCIAIGIPMSLMGQTDLISGIVNDYAQVTAIDIASGTITVDDASAFNFDDQVLLIQMQGAGISSADNSSFGDLTGLNGAGSYEFNSVCLVNGNDITLQNGITGSYATSNVAAAGIQLVRVPFYTNDAQVTSTLTAPAWDGTTGGVLAIDVNNDLILNADVDVSELGFRGGTMRSVAPAFLDCFVSFGSYYYSLADEHGGQKGEGIADYVTNRAYGRGKQANGGGGGNEHNAGGGGGSNTGAGGEGSVKSETGFFACNGVNPGIGGTSLSGSGYSLANPLIFMGGGGGAGHDNNGESSNGGNGGGIIIIKANEIRTNGNDIRADGEDVPAGGTVSDGQGGGGAGGAILLEINAVSGGGTIAATGGDGGDTSHPSNCEGPGGGGGGGAVWTAMASWGATVAVNGGAAGTELSGGGCAPNADPGLGGTTLFSLVLNTGGAVGCILPVESLTFEGIPTENGIQLDWHIPGYTHPHTYRLKRQDDFGNWEALYEVFTQRETTPLSYLDIPPTFGTQYYQLEVWDEVGNQLTTRTLSINWDIAYTGLTISRVMEADGFLKFEALVQEGTPLEISLYTLTGQQVSHLQLFADAPLIQSKLNVQGIPTGLYLLSFQQQGRQISQRVRVGGF